jgi:hypothetical protein
LFFLLLEKFCQKGEIRNEQLENDLIFGVSIVKSLGQKKRESKKSSNLYIWLLLCSQK